MNRIPGLRHLISSLPGSTLRTHVESLGKPRDVNKRSQSLAWKDTHLVFSIYYVCNRVLFTSNFSSVDSKAVILCSSIVLSLSSPQLCSSISCMNMINNHLNTIIEVF